MTPEELRVAMEEQARRIPGGDKVLQGLSSAYGDLSQGRVPAWPPAPPPQAPNIPLTAGAPTVGMLDPLGTAKAAVATPDALAAAKGGDLPGAINQAVQAQRPDLSTIATANQGKANEAARQNAVANPKQVNPNDAEYAHPMPGGPGGGMPGYSFGQPTIIPAHEARAVGPTAERQMLLGQNRIEAGAREGIDAEAQKQEGLSKLNDRRAEQYEDMAQMQEKREKARADILNGHFKDQEQLAADIRAQKFDPNGFWGKGAEGATKKVVAVIAQALGGFVQGMRGGPNAATQLIDAAQDRYMDSMKQQMAAKKDTLAEGSNLLAQKMRQFGDERTAEAAAKDDMLKATQAQIESFMAQSQSDAVRARGDQLLGEIQQKRGELWNKMHPWVQAQAVGGAGAGGGTLDGETLHIGNGLYVKANGPIGTDLAKTLTGNQEVVSGLRQLRGLITKRTQLSAAGGNASEVEQQIDRLRAHLISRMSQASGAGNPSEGDSARAIDAMGLNKGMAAVLRPDSTSAIDSSIRDWETARTMKLRTVGGTMYQKTGQRLGHGGKWEDTYVPAGDVTSIPDPDAKPPPAVGSFKPVGGK